MPSKPEENAWARAEVQERHHDKYLGTSPYSGFSEVLIVENVLLKRSQDVLPCTSYHQERSTTLGRQHIPYLGMLR